MQVSPKQEVLEIETNFGWLLGNSTKLDRPTSVVFAVTKRRTESEFLDLFWTPRDAQGLQLTGLRLDAQGIPVETRLEPIPLPENTLYVFDLITRWDALFASVATLDSRGCVSFQVLKFQVSPEVTLDRQPSIVWTSQHPCLRLNPQGNVGWHDYQGKLALANSSTMSGLLISTGLLVAETTQDAFPNDGFIYEQTYNSISELTRAFQEFGSIIQIDVTQRKSSVIAKGLRGPSGVVATPQGIFIADHGPRGGDELNLLTVPDDSSKGVVNFGWPDWTFGLPYEGAGGGLESGNLSRHLPKFGVSKGVSVPVFVWSPSIAPQNLIECESLPRPKVGSSTLIMGSLKSQSLHFIDLLGDSVLQVETVSVGERIRDMDCDVDRGYLLFSTDSGRIALLRFTSSPEVKGMFPPVEATRDGEYWFNVFLAVLKLPTSWLFEPR